MVCWPLFVTTLLGIFTLDSSLLVSCAPIKLVSDLPSFVTNLLNSNAHIREEQQLNLFNQEPAFLLASSSSHSYLTNFADDDSDELENRSIQPIKSSTTNSLIEELTANESLDTNESVNHLLPSNINETQTTTTSSSASESSTMSTLTNLGLEHFLNLMAGSSRKSQFIRMPNGISYQFCNSSVAASKLDLKCNDENAFCKLGACVCKPGFFLNRQSNLCQSISDLLKNCENDHQCQAFNVDLICETKLHERPFCDCADGLHFDQDSITCLPCHRNTLIMTSNINSFQRHGVELEDASFGRSDGDNADSDASGASLNDSTIATTSSNKTSSSSPNNESQLFKSSSSSSSSTQIKPCRPIDLSRMNSRRKQQLSSIGLSHYGSIYDQNVRSSSSQTTTTTSTISSSDPFRIRTPLEVFMGAIMLFTLFTVAWFFLQRMIHDCRTIFRSLRNPEFSTSCTDQNFMGPLRNVGNGLGGPATGGGLRAHQSANHLYFDPTGQAVARLFSGEPPYNQPFSGLTTGIYQRGLAGVMVQHLANLSPSSTSHALVSNGSTRTLTPILGNHNEHDSALYPLTASAQQSRNAAAAAAAQLLLSPTHPAIAILRAAAASAAQNSGNDYASANLLNSMFDPPPKYEEAIAQACHPSYPPHSQPPPPPPPPLSPPAPPPPPHPSQASDTNISLSGPNQQTQLQQDSSESQESPTSSNGSLSRNCNLNDDRNENNSLISRNRERDLTRALEIFVPSNEGLPYSSDLIIANTSDNTAVSREMPQIQHEPTSEQTSQRLYSTSNRRKSRRSRRGRGSASRNQQQAQDSDDTLTGS